MAARYRSERPARTRRRLSTSWCSSLRAGSARSKRVTLIRDGIPASPAIVIGPAYVLRREPLRVPHVPVAPEQPTGESARFHASREWARGRLRSIQAQTAEKLGSVEAQIFEPQILMLDDPDLVEGTVSYIRDNLLGAARAFELRMLEYQSDWSRSGHPMVMD